MITAEGIINSFDDLVCLILVCGAVIVCIIAAVRGDL